LSSDMQLLSEMHVVITNPNLVLLHAESCDIPKALGDLCAIDAFSNQNWWCDLLVQLCSVGKPNYLIINWINCFPICAFLYYSLCDLVRLYTFGSLINHLSRQPLHLQLYNSLPAHYMGLGRAVYLRDID
jgi:hypothetical protein